MTKKSQTNPAPVAAAAQTQEEPAPPTKLELAVAKAEMRLEGVKHLSATDLGVQYIFPLLRKIAKELGDHDESFEDLSETLEQALANGGFGDDAVAGALEGAQEAITKLAELLDQVMVASGFYSVVPGKGLKAEKVPAQIRAAYEGLRNDILPVVAEIQNALQALEEGDEGDEGDEGEEGDEDLAEAQAAIANVGNLDAPAVPEPAEPESSKSDVIATVADLANDGKGGSHVSQT